MQITNIYKKFFYTLHKYLILTDFVQIFLNIYFNLCSYYYLEFYLVSILYQGLSDFINL